MKRVALLLLLLLALAGAAAEAEITSKAQLNQPGMRVGVDTGSAAVMMVKQELPNAELVYLEGAEGYEAVALGKIDAYVYDRRQMELAIASGRKGVHLLDENMEGTVSVAAGISPASQIPDLEQSINAFLAEIRADGTLGDMYRRWVTDSDMTMPDIAMPADPKLHIVVGTSGIVPPFSYYAGTELTGYDIEMARRFAAWMDADVSFKVYDYGSIIIAAATGDVDLIMANLNVTPERAEALTFSDSFYTLPVAIMVKGDPRPEAAGGFTSLDQLDGRRIGVQTGTTAADITLARLPHAQISYFSTFPDMAVALKTRKIDGFPGDGLVLKQMAHEDPSLRLLDEKLRSYDCGFVLPKDEKGEALCAELNAWIKDMRESGELDRILKKWTEASEEARTVPDYKSLPAPKGVLTMTTEGTFPPMNYYRGDECVGMEIELCARFCEANGYGLNVTTMDFDGMLAAVQARKVDFAISGIAITEERRESVLFSDPYYTGGTMMAVLNAGDVAQSGFTTLDRLNGKRIGIQTGTNYTDVVLERLPDAQISYFNTYTDMVEAVEAHKIDGFPGDEPVLRMMATENDKLEILDETLESIDMGFVLPKTAAGEKLRDELNEWIAAMKADGSMDALFAKWVEGPESARTMPDYADLPAPNGTLRFATEAAYAPMNYVRDGKIVGLEVEMAARFCAEYGYGMTVQAMNFDGLLPAIQSDKADFVAASIAITEERRESVNFSDPYYTAGTVVAVLRDDQGAAAVDAAPGAAPKDGIRASIHKTFIREDRWRLFASGVVTTLIITLLSILFGTLLGFVVFMLCRNGNPAANLITRFCLWLVQGMPMVVLLMVLYYIIFGSVSISGIAVAVVGFTLTFGAAVFGLLRMGVGAVDGGQYEAAYALGYSNRRTFFKIILPQALPHVLPAFRGEVVGLIKATAIVGYIAVQDLTKMGDIVRSRTYEAFFPLIAVTIIYFVLEGLIKLLIGGVTWRLDPRRRKPEDILKGVKTDD